MIDQQLRSNDCGISALKTICNVLGVNISRDVIESAIPLDEYGSTLGSLRDFLLEYGFNANYKLLDLNSVNENKDLIKSWLPCIVPVCRQDQLHYVVISDVKDNRLVIMDPAKVRPYKVSIQEFKKEAFYSETELELVDVEEKIRVEVIGELKNFGIKLPYQPAVPELMELFNKLTYFGFVNKNFGFVDKKAAKAFLKDLVFNQDLKHVPEHFKKSSFQNNKIKIETPLLLSVQKMDTTRELSIGTDTKYIYWRLFKSISSMRELWYIFLGTALVAAFISYISVFINQLLIDHILPSYDMGTLGLFVLAVAIFNVVQMIVKIYKKYISIHLSNSMDRYFLSVFDQKLSQYSIQYIQSFKRGDLTERLKDSLRLKSFFTAYFSSIIVNLLVAIVSLFFLFMLNWKLSFVVIVVLFVFVGLFYLFTPIIEQIERQRFQKKANYFSMFIEKIDGLQSIKALGLEKYSSAKIMKSVDELIRVNTKAKYVGIVNGIATSLVTMMASLALLYLTSQQMIVYNTISLGMIMTFLALSGKIFGAFSSLLDKNLVIQENKVILNRFFDFDEHKIKANKALAEEAGKDSKTSDQSTVIAPSQSLQALQTIRDFKFKQLTLKNVSFGYLEGKEIFSGVNITIKKGEKIWIKGENGSGKSTLCKIMGLLYEPSEGELLLNDLDFSLFARDEIRKKINFISGDDILFNETLLFNITFGRKVNMRRLIEYAKVIGFHSFVNSKPDKFNFVVHENGRNLSTGQRRKVLLLRALMMDAKLIILDEIFNGMDQDSKNTAETLLALMNDRAFVIVSHMPINNITFNQKFVLNDGRLLVQDA